MNKKKILYWLERYNKEEDKSNSTLEEKLGRIISKRGFLTKEDLKKIIKWKFQGRLKGRQLRTLNIIKKVSNSEIKIISGYAFKCNNDLIKLKLLMVLKGVKIALASTILAFFDPQNYYVFDIHVYDEMFKTNSKTRPKDLFSNPLYYLSILKKIRGLAKKYRLRARYIEKAIFKKNLEAS